MKILENYISGKGFIFHIYSSSIARNKTAKIKCRQKIWTGTWPKKIYLQLLSPWKEVQHHLINREMKLKLQWDTARNVEV